MKESRYIGILDDFSLNNLKINVADVFRILKFKKLQMIVSYGDDASGFDHTQQLIDELEKLQYLWCLVEQNSSLTLDRFKYNLMHSTATNWLLRRQEIERFSCDQNLRFFPYLKIGDGLYLVWCMLNLQKQSSSNFNNYQHHLYSHLNGNATTVFPTNVTNAKHLQPHLYFDVLFRLKQYLSTTHYQPNYVIPDLVHQVTSEQLLDTLLERYQSIFCLTLNIQLPFKSSEMDDYHSFIQDRLMRIPELQQMMQGIAGLLFMMTKVEHDLVSGLNLSVVLILNKKKEQVAAKIIKRLQSEFKKILIDRAFHIHHWGEQLAQELKKNAIDGEIKLTDERKVKDFKYWILNFLRV